MIGCGTTIFTDPDDYCANLPDVGIDLVRIGGGSFRARVTWYGMRQLRLVGIEESMARIAFLSLAPNRVFVSFSSSGDPSPIWNGMELLPGEIVLHGCGERFHQRTRGKSGWALISLPGADLTAYGHSLVGVRMPPPSTARILRPPRHVMAVLRRLHGQACRLARLKPELAAHPEVARAFEQDLVHALVNCLAAREARSASAIGQRRAEIMTRFEQTLAAHDEGLMTLPQICSSVGVPERTLRACCTGFLGMGPVSYHRLRRLNLVRAALLCADPSLTRVATAARRYGFLELGRFAAAYKAAFGETPSATLRGGRALRAEYA